MRAILGAAMMLTGTGMVSRGEDNPGMITLGLLWIFIGAMLVAQWIKYKGNKK